jgi:hypothetical protein
MDTSSERIMVRRRFRGPPESGHGGYTCGLIAALIDGPVEVTLRRPPPLDRELEVRCLDGGRVEVYDRETLIAEAAPATLEMPVPAPVSHDEAAAASEGYLGFQRHLFPSCFGCGPERAEGDGLRIFAGRVRGRDLVAAPWTPDGSLASGGGEIRPEFVWAALDDSGAWSLQSAQDWQPIVLGRLAAVFLDRVRAGERCVVIGWPLGQEERKAYSGTALFGEDGSLRAYARATWVRLRI